MPENMAPGVAILDFDGDGRLDIYVTQGAPLPLGDLEGEGGDAAGEAEGEAPRNALFRQGEDGLFRDMAQAAGADDSRGYGMGASFGDIDGDGDLDLYVANFGRDTLLINKGDGSFTDESEIRGLRAATWSTGSGFFDADGDGDLDLFVATYVDFAFDNHKWCGNRIREVRSYCHPDVYGALPDLYYRNNGGTFVEATQEAGIVNDDQGKGLGVGLADLTGDGFVDIFVANDSTFNYLHRGNGGGGFAEEALFAGLAVNGSGVPEAGMGVEIGDLTGDGGDELFLTHLDLETNTLYVRSGDSWSDATAAAGLAAPSLPWVSFGNVFLDHDDDGDLDVFIANGHIIDNIELFDASRSYRQPPQLFDNNGKGQFREISERLGIEQRLAGRGAVAADLDRDGDLDLVIAQNNAPVLVLENVGGSAGGAVTVRLEGGASNPQAFGARLDLELGDRRVVRSIRSTRGYLSQGPPVAHFGLARREASEALTIRWPSGRVQRLGALAAGIYLVVPEPSSQ